MNDHENRELTDTELDAVPGGKAGTGASSYGPGYNS
jgi:hypothetical protein